MKRIFKKENITYGLLALLIILQLTYLIYCFVIEKKGYHSDEIYSYATANSYGMPFIGFEGRNDKSDKHKNEWYDGELFDNYLSVDEEDKFEYEYILKNENDIHAPLYFMILHTICSFFEGDFSWWFGFSINIVVFILTQIVLYLFVKELTEKKWIALLICFVYGFSVSGISTFIYIRMYALLTFLGVLLMYLHILLMKGKLSFGKSIVGISLVTLLGALTHLYFLAFAGSISACFCFYFLFKKEYKKMLIYAVMQIAAVICFLFIHPYVLAELFDVNGNVTNADMYLGFDFENRVLLAYMIRELTAYPKDALPSYFLIHLAEVLFWAVMIITPISFLCRKEVFFHKIVAFLKKQFLSFVKYVKTHLNIIHISMAVTIFVYILAVSATAMVYGMGASSTRYVFLIYPFIFVAAGLACVLVINFLINCIVSVLKSEQGKKIAKTAGNVVVALIAVVYIVIVQGFGVETFYFDFENGTNCDLTELPRDANYVFALDTFWLVDCLSYEFRGTEGFYATRTFELADNMENIEDNPYKGETYFVLECPSMGDLIENTSEVFEFTSESLASLGSIVDLDNEKVKEYVEEYENVFVNSDKYGVFEYAGTSVVFGRYVFVYKVSDVK